MNLKEALASLEKDYGKGAVMDMGDEAVLFDPTEMISTGVLPVDIAIGGGVPRGGFTEIIGPESVGKSTLCLHIISEAQKYGKCLFIDTEHAFDPVYATALSVDMQKLLLSQPGSAEEALEITYRMAQTGEVALIVIDSVAALVSQAELNGQMGDAHIAGTARLMGQGLRKLTPTIGRTNTAIVFTNQLRDKIGGYGATEITTGGKSLKYFAHVRLDLRRVEFLKDGPDIIGSKIRCKVIKNKLARPQRVADFEILFGEGVSREGSILDAALELGLVIKKGSYFMDVEAGENLGQGREKTKLYLREHPELAMVYYQKAFGR